MSTRTLIPMKPVAAKARPLTHAPGALLQRKCACGGSGGVEGECEDCKKKKLQRRTIGNAAGPAVAPPIVRDVLRSPGQPLDAASRSFFEPRFRHDFSRVRIHADEKAAESAQAVNALAYTVGSNVVFGPGKYDPSAQTGQQLLAHELAHVVQQGMSESSQETLTLGQADDSYEKEADRCASLVVGPQSQPQAQHCGAGGPSLVPRLRQSVAIQRKNIPTGISLKETHALGHSNLKTEEDKKKFLTYIADVSLMQLTPTGKYTEGQKQGDCTREYLTEVSNTCPGSRSFCGGHKCFQVNQYKKPMGDGNTGTTIPDGPDTFVDFHRAQFATSLLEGSGKKQCSVVCHQLYKYQDATAKTVKELGAFYIIRNFREDKFTPAGSITPINITTGEIKKVAAGSNAAPGKDDFAKKVAPGLVQSGALLDAPAVPQSNPASASPSAQPKGAEKK